MSDLKVFWTSLHFLLSLIALVAECLGAESKGFVPPVGFQSPKAFVPPIESEVVKPPPATRQTLQLIVPVSAAVPGANPLDASVIVATNGTDASGKIQTIGSGTIIQSEDGHSTILTCAHNLRGIANPSVSITSQTKLFIGKVVKVDDKNDLALISVAASLPAADLSSIKPKIGEFVTSIGIGKTDHSLETRSHKITAIDKYTAPRNFESDGQQDVGRSGGGLFYEGMLVGVIQGRRSDLSRPIYVSLEPIRDLLAKQTYGSNEVTECELYLAPFVCPPCNVLSRALGDGTPDISIKRLIGPKTWDVAYPLVRIKDASGTWHLLSGIGSLKQLERNIALLNAGHQTSSSRSPNEQPVGITLKGASIVKTSLDTMTSFLGDGSTVSFSWKRIGAKDALLVNEKHTQQDIFGTSGHIEIGLVSSKHLPINRIAFAYRFGAGSDGKQKLFLKTDQEVELEIPEKGIVGSAPEKVGIVPILVAYEVISIGYDIYELFHPSIDLFLGTDIHATAKLNSGVLAIDFGSAPPAIRAHWSFMFGLVKFEYSRDLTGLVLSTAKAIVQFHHSRIYRDVSIPIEE